MAVMFLLALVVAAALLICGLVLVIVLIRSEHAGVRAFGWILLAIGCVFPLLAISWVTVARVTYVASAPNVEVREYSETFDRSSIAGESAEIDTLDDSADVPSPATPSLETTAGVPSAWLPEVSQNFIADVYPSSEDALESLGRRAVEVIRERRKTPSDSGSAPSVQISTVFPNASELPEVASRLNPALAVTVLTEQISAAFPGVDVKINPPDAKEISASDAEVVQLQLTLSQWTTGNDTSSGLFQLIIDPHASPQVTTTARFTEKLWVESLNRYESLRADGKRWIVGRSSEFASTERDALDAAVFAAARMVNPRGGNQDLSRWVGSGELTEDRFVQRFSRPYGEVWRAAVLVDVSPERIDGLERLEAKATARVVSTFSGRLLAFALLMIVAVILFLILNYLTGGYYRAQSGMTVGVVLLLAALTALTQFGQI